MRHRTRVAAMMAGSIAAGAAAAVMVGSARWSRQTARATRRLTSGVPVRRGPAAPRFALDQLHGLPVPVARYFEYALTPGQRVVRRARMEHAGDFLLRPRAWSRFTSVEVFTVCPPGFVWDATIHAAPLVAVRVRDMYSGGEGSMKGAIAGLVPVVDQHGTREMAEASLQRYLAEAPWVPTALLPGAGVRWSAVDDTTARATLVDGAVTASVDFHFGADGAIERVSAVRWRDVDGTPVATPWAGRLWDYRRLDGMMVPTAGEVAWHPPEGPLPYWRGRVLRVVYEYGAG